MSSGDKLILRCSSRLSLLTVASFLLFLSVAISEGENKYQRPRLENFKVNFNMGGKKLFKSCQFNRITRLVSIISTEDFYFNTFASPMCVVSIARKMIVYKTSTDTKQVETLRNKIENADSGAKKKTSQLNSFPIHRVPSIFRRKIDGRNPPEESIDVFIFALT